MHKLARLSSITILVVSIAMIMMQSSADDSLILQLDVGGVACDLAISEATIEPEATPEVEDDADDVEHPTIILSDDCADVLPLLQVASNGTLWIALTVPDEDDWQEFEPVSDTENPPQFDRRGRYIGCANPDGGDQVCAVLWTQDELTYRVEIPFFVGSIYNRPIVNTTTSESEQSLSGASECSPDGYWYSTAEALAINGSLAPDGLYECQGGIVVRVGDATSEQSNTNSDSSGSNKNESGKVCIMVTSCDDDGNCETGQECYKTSKPNDPCSDPNYGGPCGSGGSGGADAGNDGS